MQVMPTMKSLVTRRIGVNMYNPVRELKEAVGEMKAAGLSNTEIVLEFLGALLVFSPVLLMFL